MKVEESKKYKSSLYTSLSSNLEAFEKNFILLSTGILAFSITFIKDIVKINEAVYLYILFLGWLLILVAIGLMMYAFLSSVDGTNRLWKMVDDYIVNNKKFDADEKLSDDEAHEIKTQTNTELFNVKNRLKYMRKTAVGLFLLGVLLFSTFVGINLYRENVKDNSLKIVNSKKSTITIKAGAIQTTTNDSIIIINH